MLVPLVYVLLVLLYALVLFNGLILHLLEELPILLEVFLVVV